MAVALYVQSLLQKKNKFQKIVLAMELIFLSTGFFSTLMMIKSSVVSHLPKNLVPTTFKSLLSSPLYMIIFMNLMIALIAASSYFHKLNKDFSFEAMAFLDVDAALLKDPFPLSSQPPPAPPPPPSMPLPSAPPIDDIHFEALDETASYESHFWKDIIVVAEASKINKMYSLQSSPDVDVISRTQSMINDYEQEKQIQVVEGLVLEEDTVNDEDGDNSLEEMWKVISGGAENSVKPELQKCETCPIDPTNIGTVQSIDSRGLLPTAAAAWKELRKSVTFDDTISMRKRAGLMRDCLMSQESFGKRADDFINKFKNTMRMERQESIIRSRKIRQN